MNLLSTRIVKLITTPHAVITSFILNFLYTVVFDNLNVDFFSLDFFGRWIFIFALNYYINKLVRDYYKPSYFNKDKLTLSDVIRRNTSAGSKFDPMYKDKDYQIHFEFDVTKISLYVTFLTFFFILSFSLWFQVDGFISATLTSPKIFLAFVLLIMYTFFMQTVYLIAYDLKHGIQMKKDRLLYTLVTLFIVSGLGFGTLTLYIAELEKQSILNKKISEIVPTYENSYKGNLDTGTPNTNPINSGPSNPVIRYSERELFTWKKNHKAAVYNDRLYALGYPINEIQDPEWPTLYVVDIPTGTILDNYPIKELIDSFPGATADSRIGELYTVQVVDNVIYLPFGGYLFEGALFYKNLEEDSSWQAIYKIHNPSVEKYDNTHVLVRTGEGDACASYSEDFLLNPFNQTFSKIVSYKYSCGDGETLLTRNDDTYTFITSRYLDEQYSDMYNDQIYESIITKDFDGVETTVVSNEEFPEDVVDYMYIPSRELLYLASKTKLYSVALSSGEVKELGNLPEESYSNTLISSANDGHLCVETRLPDSYETKTWEISETDATAVSDTCSKAEYVSVPSRTSDDYFMDLGLPKEFSLVATPEANL